MRGCHKGKDALIGWVNSVGWQGGLIEWVVRV